MARRSFGRVFFGGVLGALFFLLLLGLLNVVAIFVPNVVFQEIVAFFNYNLLLLLFIHLVVFLGNLFGLFMFPFSLVYPLLNAFGSMLVLVFILRVLRLVGGFVGMHVYHAVYPLYVIALFVVPLIVLIVGYVQIFTSGVKKLSKRRVRKAARPKPEVEWSDVGDEFRKAFYELGCLLQETFAESRKSGRKKK